jgi:hypothetical protein
LEASFGLYLSLFPPSISHLPLLYLFLSLFFFAYFFLSYFIPFFFTTPLPDTIRNILVNKHRISPSTDRMAALCCLLAARPNAVSWKTLHARRPFFPDRQLIWIKFIFKLSNPTNNPSSIHVE